MAYYARTVSDEVRQKAELSRKEAEEFIERELKCPVCGYIVGVAYSDSKGHLKIKCQKCKTISVINFAYFYRRKNKQRYKKSSKGF